MYTITGFRAIFIFLVLPCIYFRELSGVVSKIGKLLLFPVSSFTDLPLSLFIFLLIIINLVIYTLIGFSPLLDLFLSSKAAVFRHTVYFTTFKQTFSLEKIAPLLGLWVFLTPLILNVPRKKTVFLILLLSSPVFNGFTQQRFLSLFIFDILPLQASSNSACSYPNNIRICVYIVYSGIPVYSNKAVILSRIRLTIFYQQQLLEMNSYSRNLIGHRFRKQRLPGQTYNGFQKAPTRQKNTSDPKP